MWRRSAATDTLTVDDLTGTGSVPTVTNDLAGTLPAVPPCPEPAPARRSSTAPPRTGHDRPTCRRRPGRGRNRHRPRRDPSTSCTLTRPGPARVLFGLGGDDHIDATAAAGQRRAARGRRRHLTMNGSPGADLFFGGDGDDPVNGSRADPLHGRGRRPFRLEPGRRQRHGGRPGRHRPATLQRRQYQREDRHFRQRSHAPFTRDVATSRWI